MNFYCFNESNCKFETMTKEQILAAIAQAAETGLVFDTDAAFVTKVKEGNAGGFVTFWVGTQAQYNALQTIDKNCQYIITDKKSDTEGLLPKSGGQMTGEIDMNNFSIINLPEPQNDSDAATKKFVLENGSAFKESDTYAGCYYREVDGVTEWLNPPMVLGTEYRTVERFKNKVVYVKAVNFGALPDQDQKSVSGGIACANVVSCIGYAKNTTDKYFEHFPIMNANSIAAQFYYEDKSIVVNTFGVGENYKECVFYMRYTK